MACCGAISSFFYILETSAFMNYAVPLRYFIVMTVMLLLTGLWMFTLHTSLSIDGTMNYYSPKSFYGLLETVNPHLFGMGLLVFILTHFFAVLKGVEQKKYRLLSVLFFVVMLVANLSGFFITEGGVFLSVVKLLSTLLFIGFILVTSYKLFKIT